MSSTAAAIAEGLDTAKSLVQIVSRTFYSTRQSIVLDQLIRKEAMRDDQIAGLLGMTTKDITKILLILVRDQVVAVHRRSELRVGAPKASMRTYYYLDYSHSIDVIKWRMYKIQNEIDKKLRNELQAQGYVCTRCKAAYKVEDVQHLVDLSLGCFICESPGCNTELIDNANVEEVQGSKDRMQRLIVQTKTIRDLLKKMDNVLLPRFDVAKWLALNALPGVALDVVSGANAPVKIELAGDDDEALMKAQREADAEEKRIQNQLPSWIAQSTVSGEATAAHLDSIAKMNSFGVTSRPSLAADSSTLNAAAAASSSTASELDSYYASLERAHSLATATSLPPSPLFSPSATPKVETTSEEEDEDTLMMDAVGKAEQRGNSSSNSTSGNENGKRSRDEPEQENAEVDATMKRAKRMSSEEQDEKPILLDGVAFLPSKMESSAEADEKVEPAEEEEEEEDDFEEVDGDSNPMIAVAGKMLPYDQVRDDDDLSAAMTPDEYTAYWEVYQRLGG